MRIGLGISLSGGGSGGSGILARFDFTALPAGEQAATLFGGLVAMDRADAGQFVQVGTSSVLACGNANRARVGRALDSDPLGIVIDRASTSDILDWRDITSGNWTAGSLVTTTPNAVAGPDGQSLADRSNITSGGFSRYRDRATDAARTFSLFARANSGTSVWVPGIAPNAGAGSGIATTFASIDTTWRRADLYAALVRYAVPCDARSTAGGGFPSTTAGARDVCTDMPVLEPGKFPTEPFATSRAGERLYHSLASSLVSGGRCGVEIVHQPKGSSAEYGADMRINTFDANTYALISATTGAATVVVNGSSYTTASSASWARANGISWWFEYGGVSLITVVKYRIGNGAASVLGTSGAPQGMITPSSTMDWLCNGTANQFDSRLQSMTFYAPGRRPAWAA